MENDNKQKIFMILLLAAFIDVLGFSIIIPILPFWVTSLGGDSIIFGILLSVYSIFQFLFAPFWGKLSDKVGRKPVFMTGLFGSFMSFSLLVIVALFFNTITSIFITRMFEGIFTSATLPSAYAYISDISSSEEKTSRFGFIGAMAGLGLTLGPFLGGLFKIFGSLLLPLSNGYWAPALFASSLSLINLILGIKFLPKLVKENKNSSIELHQTNRFIFFILSSPILILGMLVLATVNFSFSSMESILALFGMARITGFSELDTGILFLLVGILLILTQGIFIQKLSKKISDIQIIIVGLFLLGIGFFLAIYCYSMTYMLIVAFPIAIGISLTNPSAISLISKNIPHDKQGQLMGINESLGAFMRIVGPLIGTNLFVFEASLPWLFSSIIILFLLIVFTSFSIIFTKKLRLNKPVQPTLN